MAERLAEAWTQLSVSPLLWLTVTLAVYCLAAWLYKKSKGNPIVNPVALSMFLIIGILLLSRTPYADYFRGAHFIHFLLGPATVALAVPLYNRLSKLRSIWLPVLISLVLGVSVAALSAMGMARLLGASRETLISLAPKSVTAPVAMGIAEKIGGIPSLTAALVVSTGILGAIMGTGVFALMGVKDDSIKGIAMGTTSHGIGTARAFQVSPEMGAFSGLAMALSAFATSVIVPWLVGLLGL